MDSTSHLENMPKTASPTPAESPYPPAMRYLMYFRTTMDKMTRNAVVFGVVSMLFQLAAMISVWTARTSWLSKVPCSFQESMASFATLSKVANRVVEFGTLIPGIGFCLYGVYYLRPVNKKANVKQWHPMNTKTVGFLCVTTSFVFTIKFHLLPFACSLC